MAKLQEAKKELEAMVGAAPEPDKALVKAKADMLAKSKVAPMPSPAEMKKIYLSKVSTAPRSPAVAKPFAKAAEPAPPPAPPWSP